MTTIEEAKTWLVKHAVAGHPVDCPVCEQRVVIYKRKLNSGMARVLIRAARLALTKEDPHRCLRGYDVPRRVHIYNNTCVGFSKERTNVSEALGDHFSYRELLGG
jgi:hypothetical protein